MKDRLAELRGIQQNPHPEYEEIGLFEVHETNPFLNDFFSQIEVIQQDIADIRENVQEIEKIHENFLSGPQLEFHFSKEYVECENAMTKVLRRSNRVKTNLKGMEKSINDQDNSYQGNFADIRIKKCQYDTLLMVFVEVMTEYNYIQNKHRENCKCKSKRNLEIADKLYTDEELEELIESKIPAIFEQEIKTDMKQAKPSQGAIEARHNDIINLQTRIKELELFELLSYLELLAQSRNEMIDRIEYNFEQAAEHVQRAVVDTKKAVRYQRKARMKKIFKIAICIAIMLLILGIALYFGLS